MGAGAGTLVSSRATYIHLCYSHCHLEKGCVQGALMFLKEGMVLVPEDTDSPFFYLILTVPLA